MDDPTFITMATINTSSNFLRRNNYYFETAGSSILEPVSNSNFDALFIIAKTNIDVARGLGHFGSELGNLLGLQGIAAFALFGSGQGTWIEVFAVFTAWEDPFAGVERVGRRIEVERSAVGPRLRNL